MDYCNTVDTTPIDELKPALHSLVSDNYHSRCLHPFGVLSDTSAFLDQLWIPFRQAFTAMQRRVDIFLANYNALSWPGETAEINADRHKNSVWTCQMGHFMGLMDRPWLDIPPTNKIVLVRFAEFHRVYNNRIEESALFFDLINVMRQAGHYPLPPQTGASLTHPGPQTHDGIMLGPQPEHESARTQALIDSMVSDLSVSNERSNVEGDNHVPTDVLAKSWADDMVWYGPEGIGATYTIDRYQQQHQYPFRFNLSSKQFNGHVVRISEGHYGAFFGWPNLSNTADGGFLGLPGSGKSADMRVVDVYRREGNKLKENWVIIDIPHWLSMQGLDVLRRMRQLLAIETIGQ